MMPASKSSVVSNLEVMRVLFAKDWRLFRAPMIALIVVGLGCYLIALFNVLYPQTQQPARESWLTAAAISFELTGLLASAFGGVAIAGERADRTANFVAMLPVTRFQIILSKWLVSISMISAFAVLHLLVIGICTLARSYTYPGDGRLGDLQWAIALEVWIGFTASLFGIAWLLGTFLRSGPISACISIAVTIASFLVPAMLLDGGIHGGKDPSLVVAPLTIFIGVLCTIGGACYYTRRVAP
jgi:ABC-type transport system involved in multi-copper enzyme maturation permease subunit